MKIIKGNQNTKECKKWEHEKNWEKKCQIMNEEKKKTLKHDFK
jgi:hypothetical protein